MKKIVVVVFTLLLFSSCTEVVFEEAQPVGVKEIKSFPKELRGEFTFVILNEETVLEIAENYITNEDGKAYLSDSLVVKKLGNSFIVNRQIAEPGDKQGKWQTYVLEDKGCGFVKATTFITTSDTYAPVFIAQYEGTELGEGQSKSIIINPSADQFNQIMADDSIKVSVILERLE